MSMGFHAPVVVQSAIIESGRTRTVSPGSAWARAVWRATYMAVSSPVLLVAAEAPIHATYAM